MSSSSKLAQTLGVMPGTVYVVGNGEVYGEVGMDDVREITHPISINELEYEPIIEIASSSLHTLALNKQGKIWSWGCNEFGALGRTGTESSPRLINHPSIKYIKFNKIACGGSISMAISSKGQLYTWGTFQSSHGVYGYLPNTEIQTYPRIDNTLAKINVIDIAAGASHCLALSDEGKVYSWGCGDFSQLGRGIMNEGDKHYSLVPVALELEDIVSIACGAYHSFAVNLHGQFYAWGMNHFQQCGLVEKVSESEELMPGEIIYEPTLVPYFKMPHLVDSQELESKQYDPHQKKRIIQVDILDEDDDEVVSTTETVVQQKQEVISSTDIDLSAIETLTLEKTTDIYLNAPQNNNVGARIKSVSAGEHHSIVLLEDNRLIVFGRCDGGQLGVILYKNYHYMGALKSKEIDQVYAIGYPMENLWHCEEEIKQVICGSNHNLILTQDGTTYGFGHSGHFQLGLYDAQEEVPLPTRVDSVRNVGRVVKAAAGDRFSMFVIA